MEMKLVLVTIWALALLQTAKSLPCIGDSCGRLSQFYSEYDNDDGIFYIREGSQNSASSNNDDNNDEDSGNENISGFQFGFLNEQQEQQRPNDQRLSKNYQQNVGPGQGSYRSNQQPFNPSKPYDENQETQYKPTPGRKNRGSYKSTHNQNGNGGHYQNGGDGSNGEYPDSYKQGAGGDHYQNKGDEYNGHYPGSRNQGGGGGDYYQNFGGSYGRYTDRESSCPNCYATGFGNGDYNKNTINIEK